MRTSSSLSFISYDQALSSEPVAPGATNRSERRVKMLERPRREEVDTAAWMPSLTTDKQGKAYFTFLMPDSLTRWRITARGMNGDGLVGQGACLSAFGKKSLHEVEYANGVSRGRQTGGRTVYLQSAG